MTEVDVNKLIEELQELKLRMARLERENKTSEQRTTTNNELAVGDRVTIKNRIHKPKKLATRKGLVRQERANSNSNESYH
jgi:hypothetical protein